MVLDPPCCPQATLAYDEGVGNFTNATEYVYNALIAPVLLSKPNDTASFLGGLSAHIRSVGQNATADRVNQMLAVMYTDLPMSLGGINPWNFVPTCLTRSADHLFHDEVRLHQSFRLGKNAVKCLSCPSAHVCSLHCCSGQSLCGCKSSLLDLLNNVHMHYCTSARTVAVCPTSVHVHLHYV
jgi:hypothetical protein